MTSDERLRWSLAAVRLLVVKPGVMAPEAARAILAVLDGVERQRADNERLRAREAALVEIVRWVAYGGNAEDFRQRSAYLLMYHIYASDEMRQKARALLAAQDTQADGAAQGEICHECFGTGGFHHRIEDGVIVETVPDCLRCGGTSREPAGQPE